MGRNLFIRVSAVTYDEELMRREWPHLCALAWPEETGGKDPALKILCGDMRKRRGIMELAADIPDRIAYGDLPAERRRLLRPLADRLQAAFTSLETALGDRDVVLAGKRTNGVEDALDALESFLAVEGRRLRG
jgi:hypothetical protein